jgi:hypothetical protein
MLESPQMQNEIPKIWRGLRRVKRRFFILSIGWVPFGFLMAEVGNFNSNGGFGRMSYAVEIVITVVGFSYMFFWIGT